VVESDHTSRPGMLGMAIPVEAPPVVEAAFSCCRDGATAGTGHSGADFLITSIS
jgi:hypothetical protein